MNEFRQSDTSSDAYRKQMEILQKMGPDRRLAMMFELSDNLRRTVMDGIRYRHPDYTPRQVVQAYLRLLLDKPLFEQVFPGCDIKP